jgi:AAA+ superfamily predicted ATPase
MADETRSEVKLTDVAALLRARDSVLQVVSREESRIEPYLYEAGARAGYQVRFWDVVQGVTELDGSQPPEFAATIGAPEQILELIKERSGERAVWVLRDFPVWYGPSNGLSAPVVMRAVRNLATFLPGQPSASAQAIILLTPSSDVPAELQDSITVVDWPLPDRAEIGSMLDATIDSVLRNPKLSAEQRELATLTNGARDAAIDAAVGLSGNEAQACFARSLVQLGKIDAVTVSGEKERLIAKSGLIEWIKPNPAGMDGVGGWEDAKAWFRTRMSAFSPKARAYGLPAPKGVLLVGVPGCGKSHVAKSLPTDWKVPCLRLDLGSLKSKYVGESEQNLRNAFSTIDAIGPCIVLVDEIEKALAGATGESGDGGVSADALGALLAWMQDRTSQAFVIATANNAEKLPPELMRKGRFDEIWWVDLPNDEEREAVLATALRTFGRDADVLGIKLSAVAEATNLYSGAELAALVPDALFTAFSDSDGEREPTTEDFLRVAKKTTPLAKSAEAKIKALREYWTAGRARPVTPEKEAVVPSGMAAPSRQLDM